MSVILLLILAVVFLQLVSPRAASAAAWLLTLGFVFPLFTFGGGTFLWSVINVLTLGGYWSLFAWWLCCTAFGLPLAVVTSWIILKH